MPAISAASSPLTALGFALVALATALTGEFRRHGGGLRLFIGIAIVVGLLAAGLTFGNLAGRDAAMLPLIWLNTALPILGGVWVLAGLPGWPQRQVPMGPSEAPA